MFIHCCSTIQGRIDGHEQTIVQLIDPPALYTTRNILRKFIASGRMKMKCEIKKLLSSQQATYNDVVMPSDAVQIAREERDLPQ